MERLRPVRRTIERNTQVFSRAHPVRHSHIERPAKALAVVQSCGVAHPVAGSSCRAGRTIDWGQWDAQRCVIASHGEQQGGSDTMEPQKTHGCSLPYLLVDAPKTGARLMNHLTSLSTP